MPPEYFQLNGKTYQQRFRKCGNDSCKCNSGEESDLHGPYWYSTGNGGLKYVGKSLPADVLQVLELLKTEKDLLATMKEQARQEADAAHRQYSKATDEIRAIDALLNGYYTSANTLRALGLERFIIK